MKVAIHQPNYLPWSGFFEKMAMADVFVLLDTAQFSKDSFTQRTKIRIKDGWMWLTIPIEKEYHFKPIGEVRLPKDDKWMKKHKSSIVANYSKCEHYDEWLVDGYFAQACETLQAFNEAGILYLKKKLGIGTRVVRASELGLEPDLKSTEMLVDIVKKAGGDTYLSGSGGDKYQDASLFEKNGIRLEYTSGEPDAYRQRWPGFEPYMSAVDRLFNLGGTS
jgi:hypothetical protein